MRTASSGTGRRRMSEGGGPRLRSATTAAAVALALVLGVADSARAETYEFVTKWGTGGTGNGQFRTNFGVTVASNGSVYVADTLNNRIQRFNTSGSFLNTWGPFLTAANGSLNMPFAVAADDNGFVWVADQGNSRILWFQPGGTLNGKCGSAGTTPGRFSSIHGIAADANFQVYVADTGNNRIQVLNTVSCQVNRLWGSGGTGNGQFNQPSGLAVDAAGNVYVADSLNYRIQVFDSQGNFLRKWGSAGTGDGQFSPATAASGSGGPTGVAVDAWGNVYVADPGNPGNNRIQVFRTTGEYVGQFGSTGGGDGQLWANQSVATDVAGNIYVADSLNNRIQKFTAKETITVVNRVAPSEDPGRFDLKVNGGTIKAAAGDLDQASVTVARGSDVTVSAVAAAGTNQADFNTTIDCGAGSQAATSVNLTTVTADTTCTVINARRGSPLPPTGTTSAADSITATGARLKGTVNPNGASVSTCRFDYGTTTEYGQTIACSTTPTGTSPSPVAAEVSGLSGDTTYHYRLVVITDTGTATGNDNSFKTTAPTVPPTGSTAAATNVGDRSATLNASVNPHGSAVSDCHFDYGSTASYGETIACATTPTGSAPVAVSASVTGLTPGSEYHYRLVVTTSVPPTLLADDQSFTTSPPPSATTNAVSAIAATTAMFNGSVDPEGESVSTCRFDYGTTTAYGASLPCASTPSGSDPVAVSAAAAGLAAATTYHVELVLTTPLGTVRGGDKEFTTNAAPSTGATSGTGETGETGGTGGTGGTDGTSGTGGTGGTAGTVAIPTPASKSIRAGRDRRLAIGLNCPAGAAVCSGQLTVVTVGKYRTAPSRPLKVLKLGSARYTLAAGGRGWVRLRLTSAVARVLAARSPVRITIVLDPGAGKPPSKLAAKLTVKR